MAVKLKLKFWNSVFVTKFEELIILRQFISRNHAMDIPVSKGWGEAKRPPEGAAADSNFISLQLF